MTDITIITDYARRIADAFPVEKVVLFGSYAKGSASEDSDVDLLVVMDHDGPSAKQSAAIRQTVRFDGALDLVVRSSKELAERSRLGDWFIRDILEEGVPVYESAR